MHFEKKTTTTSSQGYSYIKDYNLKAKIMTRVKKISLYIAPLWYRCLLPDNQNKVEICCYV